MIVNRKLILKIVAVILTIALVVYLVIIFMKSDKTVELQEQVVVTEDEKSLPIRSDVKAVEDVAQIKAAPPVTNDEVAIKNTAKFIAEKFGSYSTDTFNFINLKDAKYLSTESLQLYIDTLIENYKNRGISGEHYGVTTKSLSVEIINPEAISTGGVVKTIVSTQKSETFGSSNPVLSTSYKKAEIEIMKVGDQWLANRIEWK